MIIHVADILLGAVVGGAGSGISILTGFVLGRRTRQAKPLTATCECKHSYGTHDLKTGLCQGTVHIPGYGHNNPCPCLHYVGPTPISSSLALPTLPPED